MDPMMEDQALVRVAARVADAEGLRRGRRLTAARRLGRRADAAAARARLARSRVQ
jgi:hypothetical protein